MGKYKNSKPRQKAEQRASSPPPHKQGQFNLQFDALDTWFFRESRPHDAVGASELSSLFPPPVRTLIGAVRSFLGEQIGIDWQAFNDRKVQPYLIDGLDFKQAVGGAENLGQLALNGPWVCHDNQRLYPAPLYLMKKDSELALLQIGAKVHCDLGMVRLPELPESCKGYKNAEQAWLTRSGWEKLLNQQKPDQAEIKYQADLMSKEPRLGIARDNSARTALKAKLYQTQHIRLKDGISVELDVHGLHQKLADQLPKTDKPVLVRLGGEGRMAELRASSQHKPLPGLDLLKLKRAKKFIIHFITHADFSGQWFPEGFKDPEGRPIWQGEINGIGLIIEAAVIGKVHREGGWDMQNHRPREVKSYVPAGSAWFCKSTDDKLTWQTLYDKLHGHCIGTNAAYGRGQVLIGLWHDNEQQ